MADRGGDRRFRTYIQPRMRVEMPETEKEQVKKVISRLEAELNGGTAT